MSKEKYLVRNRSFKEIETKLADFLELHRIYKMGNERIYTNEDVLIYCKGKLFYVIAFDEEEYAKWAEHIAAWIENDPERNVYFPFL